MNASDFPPVGLKLLQGAVQSFCFPPCRDLFTWFGGKMTIFSCRENIKTKITVCPIGHAGNMYKLPKQNMFYVLVTGPDQLPKKKVLATYRVWVLKGGPK